MLDPLIALLVAGHIALTGWELVGRSIDGLMDRALPADELNTVRSVIAGTLLAGHTVADLKTRRAGPRRFAEFKLRVPSGLTVRDAHGECDRLEEALSRAFRGINVMIHVEPQDD